MKWLKVVTLSVLAIWLAWDALEGLHFYSVQRDLGRKLEGRAVRALDENDKAALQICIAENPSVERAFAVEVLTALSVAFFAVRVGRSRRAVASH